MPVLGECAYGFLKLKKNTGWNNEFPSVEELIISKMLHIQQIHLTHTRNSIV